MNSEERQLFFRLCDLESGDFDENLVAYASPAVLGHLFYNRMQGVAYVVLRDHGLLGKVGREFRNSLAMAYEHNVERNETFLDCLRHVSGILSELDVPYALLKGAYLCPKYPVGCRTSNDIDVLVAPADVTRVGNALIQHGYQQGHLRNNVFVPATRREIIESKMLRGETVPFIKKIDRKGMRYLEIDVNFSLDYKNGDPALLKHLLDHTTVRNVQDLEIRTLDEVDFFLHLCVHLYKEATTLPWIAMMRDMTLYKYGDLAWLLHEAGDPMADRVFERAYELGLEKPCAFAILQTACMIPVSTYAVETAKKVLLFDPGFLHRVYSPQDKKVYRYTEEDIKERFFTNHRVRLLKEDETR